MAHASHALTKLCRKISAVYQHAYVYIYIYIYTVYTCIYIYIYIYEQVHQIWSNSLRTSIKVCREFTRHDQTHCTLQLSLQWLCSLGSLWADAGKCFWNTEVHVYMGTSGSDARSLFEERCISSEMTSCTCWMQKLAAAGRIQQGMCTWKLIVLMQASKEKTEICYR